MIKLDSKQTIVKFGYGDIKVTSAFIDDKGILSLKNKEFHPIGSSCPCEETVESINESEVLMKFENIKSLEVVILKLQQARGFMLGIGKDYPEIDDITELYEANSHFDYEVVE